MRAVSVTTIVFEAGVELSLSNLDPEATELLRAAALTAPPLVADALFVTSARDGIHSDGSYHYVGRAWDIRILGTQEDRADRTGAIESRDQIGEARLWAERIRKVCPEWQVVVEPDHIHAERDVRAALRG